MRAVLDHLIEDLKEQRADGVESIYWTDETIANLRAAASIGQSASAPSPTLAPAQSQPTPTPASSSNKPFFIDLGVSEPSAQPVSSPKSPPSKPTTKRALPAPPSFELPKGSRQEQWDWLKDRVLSCETCKSQVKPGKQVVFGVGSLDADIFFCGEAPGADEEVQGEPFVGKAGQLLTKIIGAMGLKRNDVYIGNIMNWRPPMPTPYGNRPPTAEEMSFCLPYLRAQLEIVQPKVIVALGATAVAGLLGQDDSRRMRDVRGRWFEFEGTDLMVTFHPSYLLRNGTNASKRTVWEDMLQVMERIQLPISEKQRGYFL